MKKSMKIFMLIIFLITIIGISSIVYADPNSSKGFATYDNDQADQETQEKLEEQEREMQQSAGKSTNNFLDNLKVEGYELSPKFDKQTLEYTINETLNVNEINIVATLSDNNAKVEGAGKVKLHNDKNEIRIDVVAESGTVRTYMIYANANVTESQIDEPTEEQSDENENLEETDVDEDMVLDENENSQEETKSSDSFNYVWIIVAVIIIVLACGICVWIVKNKNNGKH